MILVAMRARHWTVEENNVYRSGGLIIAPRPAERVLVHIYYALEASGRLAWMFHEFKPDLRWFLGEYMKPETSTLVAYREGEGGTYTVDGRKFEPLGMTWLNKSWQIGPPELKLTKAECGMCFLKGVPTEACVRIGEVTCAWAFDVLGLASLIGTTPAANRAAVLYGQKIGFYQSGLVRGYTLFNGKLADVFIQSLTRDMWREMWSGSGSGLEEAA